MLWQQPEKFPGLKNNQVHIWRAKLTRTKKEAEDFLELLNGDERKRASRFVVEHASKNFIVARGILRTLLSKYLNVDPKKIIFEQNQYGKLYLASSPLNFNLSHSGDLVLFAFSLNNLVGVDVELIREIENFQDIAEKFFSKDEVAELFLLPEDQRQLAFFNCWSRKEAFIKAKGLGVYHGLDNFSVEISAKKEGQVKLLVPSSLQDCKSHLSSPRKRGYSFFNKREDSWSLEALDPGHKYTGAFAINALDFSASFYESS